MIDDTTPPPAGNIKTWEMKMRRFLDRKESLEENTERLFGLVSGQCTQGLMAEVKANDEYDNRANACDALCLMKTIVTK